MVESIKVSAVLATGLIPRIAVRRDAYYRNAGIERAWEGKEHGWPAKRAHKRFYAATDYAECIYS